MAYFLKSSVSGSALILRAGAAPRVLSPDMQVTVRRSQTQVAPDLVSFSVTSINATTVSSDNGNYIATDREVEYVWSFTGQNNWPTASVLPTGQKDASVGFGPVIARVWDTPGTYNWSCNAYQKGVGLVGFASGSVTINDPDVVYTGGANYYVDPDGIYAGKPTGANEALTLEAALAAVKTAGTDSRIILRSGVTHTFAGYVIDDTWPNVYIEGEGVSRVSVTWNGELGGTGKPNVRIKDWTFRNLTMTGPWDSTTANGTDPNPDSAIYWPDNNDGVAKYSGHILIHDCEISNHGTSVNHSGFNITHDTSVFGFSNSQILDFKDFGVFVQFGETHLIGSEIKSNLDAVSGANNTVGDPRQSPGYQTHGPVRLPFYNVCTVNGVHTFSRCGWVLSSDGVRRTSQASLRLFTRLVSAGQGRTSVQGNMLEGGAPVITMGEDQDIGAPYPCSMLVERNTLTCDWSSSGFITVAHGGCTIRNNRMIYNNNANKIGMIAAIYTYPVGTAGDQSGTSIAEYNTIVDLSTNNPNFFEFRDTYSTNLSVTTNGNLLHYPNKTSPNTITNLSTTTAYTPLYKGYITDTFTLETAYANTPALAENVPLTGSNAIGAGDTAYPYFDFAGDDRVARLAGLTRTNATLGCVEVNLES